MICCSFGNSTQHWPMLLELLAVLPEEVRLPSLLLDIDQLFNNVQHFLPLYTGVF